MKGCVFVTRMDGRYGFTLAGFQQVLADKENVLEVVAQITGEMRPGLVFVDERLLSEKIMGRLQLLEKEWGGAIVSLPAPGRDGEVAGRDFGKRIVARVLGYQMKLN